MVHYYSAKLKDVKWFMIKPLSVRYYRTEHCPCPYLDTPLFSIASPAGADDLRLGAGPVPLLFILELLSFVGTAANSLIGRKGLKGSAMEQKSQQSDPKACVSKCDKVFIACVESGKNDCLDSFRECTLVCKV
jgi:hypothetical protein